MNEFLEAKGMDPKRRYDTGGMMTHMCVDTTVRAAMDYGYEVVVVADACAIMNLEYNGETISAEIVQKTFLAALDGVFASVI